MRNSLKLGFVLALGATAVFAGCSSGSDNTDGGAGTSAGGSTAGHAETGAAGTSIIIAGSATGGSSTGGAGTAGAGTAGAAGHAGAGTSGSGGTTGAAGAGGAGGAASAGAGGKGGAGGTTGSAGAAGTAGAAGGGAGGAGAGAGGTGGAAGGSGGTSNCAEETTGISAGAGGTGGAAATNSIYLIDDVVVTNSVVANSQAWHFPASAPLITDTTTGTGGVWVRSPYSSFGTTVGPHNTFLACDSATVDAASGSVKNLVPFTAAGEYYELLMAFASTDYSNAAISAKVKLVNDGVSTPHCAQAQIHIVGADPYPEAEGAWTSLTKDTWKSVTFTAAATGVSTTQQLGVRIKLNGTCQ